MAHILHGPALGTGAGWRQTEASDAATCPHSRGEDIFLVKLASPQFGGVQICGMSGSLGVATVTFINHRVKQVSKHLQTT